MDTVRDAIAKENTNRGNDPNIPLMGSTVKRKRLSDITNIVSSSRVVTSRSQFRENTKEVDCGITNECVTQLIEENATLLKAIGERNKIIELSSMELQKLRFTLEKANQQNRLLAQTNSQMLAELTSSKERLKVLQHELGCTVAVLKFKNSSLDAKEKLIKELSEKTRVEVECSKIDEDDMLNDEQCVKTKDVENYKCPKVTTGVSLSNSVNTSTWIPDTEQTFRSKTLGFATSSSHQQAKEKPNDESHEKIRAEEQILNIELCEKNYAEEEHLRCTEVASDAMRPHAIDSNVSCEPNKKRGLRTRSFGAITMTHQAKPRETDAIRKSSRRRSENLDSQAIESKDSLSEILDANIPACSMTSELPNENLPDNDEAAASVNHTTKATEKDNIRKSTRRRTENLAPEPPESRADLHEIMVAEVPACPVISEQMNEECTVESVNHITKTTEKDNRRKSSRRRSENLTYEPRESKTDLHEIMHVVNEECHVKPQSSAALTHKAEAEEDAKRGRKPSRRRSDDNLKPESCESNDQFPEAVDLRKPALEAVAEPQIETSLPSHSNAGKDHSDSSQCEGEESRRTSVCRPSRKAAEKVSSYKEVPLKCKMRRPE